MDLLQEFFEKHVPSFVKTYVVVFLGVVFYADSTGVDVFTLAFLVPALKASLLTALRTLYKFVVEDIPSIRTTGSISNGK